MIFANLSVAEIVGPCSVDVETKLTTTQKSVEAVEQKASTTLALAAQVRSEAVAIEAATRRESALHRLASDTIREHRAQEQRLDPDILSVEQKLAGLRRAVEGETHTADQQCREARVRIVAAEQMEARLSSSLQAVSISREQMETLRDEAEEILDRIRAISRRQQAEPST